MDEKELMKLSAEELIDLGICPTCFNRKHNGVAFGDEPLRLPKCITDQSFMTPRLAVPKVLLRLGAAPKL